MIYPEIPILPQNLDKPWDWSRLSKNRHLTPEFVEKHKERWDWGELSKNHAVTPEWIREHPDWPWNWHQMSFNNNLTLDCIEQNLDKPWNWYLLSKNLGHPFGNLHQADCLREKRQIVSPLKNEYLHKIYLGSPVDQKIDYFSMQMRLILPFPAEVSLWVYFQN